MENTSEQSSSYKNECTFSHRLFLHLDRAIFSSLVVDADRLSDEFDEVFNYGCDGLKTQNDFCLNLK